MSTRIKQLIRGTVNLHPEHYGSVVTMGAFDGVHLGHQAILRQVVEHSARLNLPSVVIIFEPLPREYFQRTAAVARILPFRDKCQALFAHGIDRILCLPFNEQLRNISPEQFIEDVLVAGLGAKQLVVGDDFRFGKKRSGDRKLLEQVAEQYQFEIDNAATVELDGERVSSTRIRELLDAGNFDDAARCLGRPFAIAGKVIQGKQLGRQLGVPTANVALKRITSPLAGIFAGQVHVPDEGIHNAVINIGVRPTVNRVDKPLLEAHLLDYSGSLYGKRVSVEFAKKLRDEKKFPSVDVLKEQINQDIEQAKQFFNM